MIEKFLGLNFLGCFCTLAFFGESAAEFNCAANFTDVKWAFYSPYQNYHVSAKSLLLPSQQQIAVR